MAIIYTQTDGGSGVCDSAAEWVACSGAGAKFAQGLLAADGGTAGSTPITQGLLASEATKTIAGFVIDPAASTSADAGTWTTRLNVTTANMNMTITAIYICRVNSSCVNQETIGSATGLSISLGSTGVKTQNVTGSAVTLAAGDRVIVVWVGSNSAMSSQSFSYTPDQNIDSPFTEAVMPEIDAASGSYSVTGSAATLAAGRLFNAEPGTISITGANATLAKGYQVNAEAGSYAVSGVDASFLKNSVISAEAGSYAISGAAATLAAGLSFNAESGAYSLSGADATFAVGFAMGLDPGSYQITGADAGLLASRILNAEAGSIVLTGVDATLAYTPVAGAFEINAEAGAYGLTGFDAGFDYSGATAPEVQSTEQPAGRKHRRRVERFIVRYKGEDLYFDDIYQIEAFLHGINLRKPKDKPKIKVPKIVERELPRYDLPSLQTAVESDWESAREIWSRYLSLKASEPPDLEYSRRHERFIFARQLELEDEELLLL